jgi:hypothetical protein
MTRYRAITISYNDQNLLRPDNEASQPTCGRGAECVTQDTETWRAPDVVTQEGRSEFQVGLPLHQHSDLCIGSTHALD